jgi:hypothetical protein
VNSDNFAASAFDTVFKTAGLDVMSYAPPSTPVAASAWPTLGSMIDSGKRLVTFLTNNTDPASVPYLIDGIHLLLFGLNACKVSDSLILFSLQNLQISGKPHST